jgi:hypothetical protein
MDSMIKVLECQDDFTVAFDQGLKETSQDSFVEVTQDECLKFFIKTQDFEYVESDPIYSIS